eukprot:scaffold24524_cov61-Attheya_sp.AAC.1
MQDNECDNGELVDMSSSDDFFSEHIQVDLDDPGIWKAKGVKMDSGHRAHLIWAYLWPEINEINVAMQEFLFHFEVTLFLDLASIEMPVEVHDLKTMSFYYVKTGTNDSINKHYQSNSNNEGHNQQESNDHIDDKDDMKSENTEESGMDG